MPSLHMRAIHCCVELQDGQMRRPQHENVGRACKAYLPRHSAHPQVARLLQQGQTLLQLRIAEPCKALVSSGLPTAKVHSAVLYAIAAVVSTCSIAQTLYVVFIPKLGYRNASRTIRSISCHTRSCKR